MSLVLLMMAMGYGNNLIYLSVFALISVAFCSMYVTNENVRRLDVGLSRFGPIFSGEDNAVSIRVTNSSGSDSHDLSLSLAGTKNQTPLFVASSRKSMGTPIVWRPLRRGLTRFPRVKLESRFPFGLLRSWKNCDEQTQVIVVPERKGDPQFPSLEGAGLERGSLGLFRDHRPFQSTDSPRRVDWRATAKYQELLVKNFEGSEKVPLHFSWEQTKGLSNFEARLSQLSLWLSRAEDMGFSYSLRLGTTQFPEAQGMEHLRQCLEKLALAVEGDFE